MFLRLLFFKLWQVRPGPHSDHRAEQVQNTPKHLTNHNRREVLGVYQLMNEWAQYTNIPTGIAPGLTQKASLRNSRKGKELNGDISPSKNGLSTLFRVFAHPQQASWEPCSLHLEANSQDLPTELKRFGRHRVSAAGLLDHSSEEQKSKCISEHFFSQQLPFLVHFLSLKKLSGFPPTGETFSSSGQQGGLRS